MSVADKWETESVPDDRRWAKQGETVSADDEWWDCRYRACRGMHPALDVAGPVYLSQQGPVFGFTKKRHLFTVH